MNYQIVFIISSVISQACVGICIKYTSVSLYTDYPISFIANPFYFAALGFMLLQAIVWQQALKHYPLSFAYPLMSLVNFVILFSAHFLFGEAITLPNIAGLIIISLGIYALAQEEGGRM